jgi:signal transduction histidine kinase
VQKILQDHGGDISLERTSAQGTVFCIILPHPATLSKGSDVQEASSAKTHAGSAKLA